jgi:hypothetical protein
LNSGDLIGLAKGEREEEEGRGDLGERTGKAVIGVGAGLEIGEPGVKLPGVSQKERPGELWGELGIGDPPDMLVSNVFNLLERDFTCDLLADMASSWSFVSAS